MPHNINLGFDGFEGEALIMGLESLAVSSGSACNSASLEPSHVLRAIGRSDEQAHASVRITLGRFSTEDEADRAASTIRDRVTQLRERRRKSDIDPAAAAPVAS